MFIVAADLIKVWPQNTLLLWKEQKKMNGKVIIEEIKKAIKDVRKNNKDVISIDALLNYLNVLDNDASDIDEDTQRKHETELAVYRTENERNLAHYNAQKLQAIEMFKSVISYGTAALKSAILINGGAAVALLAFIGNIWNKDIPQSAVGHLTSAIAYFSFGVLAAAIGTASSYITQYCYGHNSMRTGKVFHTLTLVLVIGSYVLFSFGIMGAHESFIVQFATKK